MGKPYVIGPLISHERNRVAAPVVGAIDEDPARPAVRISAKVIFTGRSLSPMISLIIRACKLSIAWGANDAKLQRLAPRKAGNKDGHVIDLPIFEKAGPIQSCHASNGEG